MPGASAGGVVNKPRTSSVELLYQGSSSEFVDALTSEVLTHVAVRHEYLLRFSRGDYPSMAFAIRDFALQYYVMMPPQSVPSEVRVDILFRLGIVDGPFAMIGGIIAGFVYLGYRIDRSTLSSIQTTLSERSSKQQPES